MKLIALFAEYASRDLVNVAYKQSSTRTPRYKVLVDGTLSLVLLERYLLALKIAAEQDKPLPIPSCSSEEFETAISMHIILARKGETYRDPGAFDPNRLRQKRF